jgi:hypothetical protein
MKLTKAQRDALQAYANDMEAPDYAEYADRAGPALGFRNRERVITALMRRHLIDEDQHITELGREALERFDA